MQKYDYPAYIVVISTIYAPYIAKICFFKTAPFWLHILVLSVMFTVAYTSILSFPKFRKNTVLQEDVFTNKQYGKYVHKRFDFFRLSAYNVNKHIGDNTYCYALGNAV